MFEEILPNLYRIEIPLPKSPLKYLNSYLIKGDGRFLIIDTGMNREGCRRQLYASLESLNVDLSKTDIFATHWHADHLGLVADLATDSSTVYFNRIEAFALFDPEEDWEADMFYYYTLHGFPEEELKKSMAGHPGSLYGLKEKVDFHILQEGDMLEVGDYSFRCIETSGHSPGHMCLYEADKKILIAGDHILFDITPNITSMLRTKNPLKNYLANLEKVYKLDVSLVLPGHRAISNDHRKRITELQKHHENRMNETLVALEKGAKSAWEVAPYITWDIGFSSWEQFPLVQKMFAFGETLAHMVCLEEDGRIQSSKDGHKMLYSLE